VLACSRIDDSKFRRVSISTDHLLFKDDDFKQDESVKQMLYALKSKYRIFLITKVDKEDGVQHKAA
jgi:hypothetical protein